MANDKGGVFGWLRRAAPEVAAPSATDVLEHAWATADDSLSGHFLQKVAESLTTKCAVDWVGLYVESDSILTRVAMSVADHPTSQGQAPTEERDEPVLPGNVERGVPGSPHAQEGWVAFPDPKVWALVSHPPRLEALLGESADGAKALTASIYATATWRREANARRKQQVDAEVHGTVVRAAMDQGATVELFLGIAISGFAGQRGFVGLWNPKTTAFRSLAIHGDIHPTMDGLSVEDLAGTWFASVTSNEHIAPDSKAVYAIARACGDEVLVCVVASASGASALSEVTASRVEQALEIIGSLQDASFEAERARKRGAAILSSLALMVDSDPTTQNHHTRVEEVAGWAGKTLGLSTEELTSLARAAALHDVGRVGLGAEASGAALEFLHPQVAAVLLETFGETPEVVRLVAHHHERHDGLGFPAGASPDETDTTLWALVAAEAIVELAERNEVSLEEARSTWARESSSGVVPAHVSEKLQAATH